MKSGLLLFVLFTFTLGCTEEATYTKPLLDFVPENASAVIKINDLHTLRTDLASNDFLAGLSKTKTFKEGLKSVEFLEFLNPKSESILSFIKDEKGGFETLYLADDTEDLIVLDSIENVTIEKIDSKGITLNKYQFGLNTFYQSTLGTKFVISSSVSILETLTEDLRQNTAPDGLAKLYRISTVYRPATLYLNVKRSDALAGSILKNDSKTNFTGFTDWMSLDFNIASEQLNLTGISIAKDSVWNFIDLFANTKPLSPITASLAPEQSDALISHTFDDYAVFAQNQKAFLKGDSSFNALFETVEEVGVISSKKGKAIILNTHGPEGLADYLELDKKETIDYQGSQIIRLKNSNLVEDGFKPLVQNFKSNFATFINDAFVFSETKEFLEFILRNHKNESTYDKGASFNGLNESLAEESNLLFISNSNAIKDIFTEHFSTEFNEELEKALNSRYDIAAQITADKNFYHTSLIIESIEKTVSDQRIAELFKIKMDTAILTKPQFVTNHLTKKKEVIFQDYNKVLYLISSEGKVLWEKQLEGQVQGTIEQVDIFKNGRLQLAFTTNNQFLVLDRNGNEVERFTKNFESGGLNPIAVFDYELKKNYRFVITQGKRIFMYDSKANIVDGFKFTEAEQAIIDAPKHIIIGNKDHLIFKLKNGALRILNRVGDIRVKVSEKIDFSENQVFLNKDKFIVTDKKGTLYQIDQRGKTKKTNLNLSKDHGMFATANTLVLMNDNILTIRGKKIELELGVYTAPKIFYLNNKIYIGVTDLQSQRVYLFDSQAQSIPKFPVFGNSIIDLTLTDTNKSLLLAVLGQENELITYKLD